MCIRDSLGSDGKSCRDEVNPLFRHDFSLTEYFRAFLVVDGPSFNLILFNFQIPKFRGQVIQCSIVTEKLCYFVPTNENMNLIKPVLSK